MLKGWNFCLRFLMPDKVQGPLCIRGLEGSGGDRCLMFEVLMLKGWNFCLRFFASDKVQGPLCIRGLEGSGGDRCLMFDV